MIFFNTNLSRIFFPFVFSPQQFHPSVPTLLTSRVQLFTLSCCGRNTSHFSLQWCLQNIILQWYFQTTCLERKHQFLGTLPTPVRFFHTCYLVFFFNRLKNKLAHLSKRCHAKPLNRTSPGMRGYQRSWNVWSDCLRPQNFLFSAHLFCLSKEKPSADCHFTCLDSCWGNFCQVCNPGI